jgi:hypothetical protein
LRRRDRTPRGSVCMGAEKSQSFKLTAISLGTKPQTCSLAVSQTRIWSNRIKDLSRY